MAKIASNIDVRSPEFAVNHAAMQSLVEDLRAALQRNALGGSATARDKHRHAGKLLARERISALLDPGSPFLELSALAAQGVYGDDLPGAGLVTGIGCVSRRPCMIVANDPTVKGGTYYPLTVKKHLRAQEIAGENALPCIYLVESGGAFKFQTGRRRIALHCNLTHQGFAASVEVGLHTRHFSVVFLVGAAFEAGSQAHLHF